jgi:hypothetical protein
MNKVDKILLDSGIKKKDRIAFVGLSSSAAYLFGFKRHIPGNPWDWNPILESPQGLSILYDNVLFLHKALCPTSMENLSFVKFIEDLNQVVLEEVLKIFLFGEKDELLLNFVDVESPPDFSEYNEHIELIFGKSPGFDNPIDNHTHEFNFHNISLHGNSQRPDLLLYDLMILDVLQKAYPECEFELVTNKFTAPRLMYYGNESHEKKLA